MSELHSSVFKQMGPFYMSSFRKRGAEVFQAYDILNLNDWKGVFMDTALSLTNKPVPSVTTK